ncbi:MAG: LURP-one-related family protein [Neisseriaceae bacterium]|nr:LURP-one-related family protein [Neisseriaceae bacterium]
MKIYIVRDTGDSKDRYSVYDNSGKLMYRVTGKYGLLGDAMYIFDENGKRVFKILQTSVQLPITVYYLSGETDKLRLTFNHMRKQYVFSGISWHIYGLAPTYEIYDADKSVVMSQKPDSSGLGYMLEINCEGRHLLCVAAAVCINSIVVSTDTAVAFQN